MSFNSRTPFWKKRLDVAGLCKLIPILSRNRESEESLDTPAHSTFLPLGRVASRR
jgi:hypothetical protein